jgi:hypothetical protein
MNCPAGKNSPGDVPRSYQPPENIRATEEGQMLYDTAAGAVKPANSEIKHVLRPRLRKARARLKPMGRLIQLAIHSIRSISGSMSRSLGRLVLSDC